MGYARRDGCLSRISLPQPATHEKITSETRVTGRHLHENSSDIGHNCLHNNHVDPDATGRTGSYVVRYGFSFIAPTRTRRLQCYVPMPTTGERFERAVAIMARLRGPGGCPWDREQTFDSIKPYTLEETYEVLEAIDNRDWEELPGELGDLLLQVLFYAQMAKDDGTFSIDDVLDRLSTKLVDRHPHVFGDVKADTSSEVLRNWQALKVEEKKKRALRNRGNREAIGICAGRRFHGDAVPDGSLQAQLAGGASRFRLAQHGRPLRKTS